jgi:hypothetical protein
MNLDSSLQSILSQPMEEGNDSIEDVLIFPAQHVRELIELCQAHSECESRSRGVSQAGIDLAAFVERCLPIARSRLFSIDLTNALVPKIRLTGHDTPPEVGKPHRGKGPVVNCWPFDGATRHRLLELIDLDNGMPAERYALWSYIASCIPEVAADPNQPYGIYTSPQWVGVVQLEPQTKEQKVKASLYGMLGMRPPTDS